VIPSVEVKMEVLGEEVLDLVLRLCALFLALPLLFCFSYEARFK
jgi:hypothetical protein